MFTFGNNIKIYTILVFEDYDDTTTFDGSLLSTKLLENFYKFFFMLHVFHCRYTIKQQLTISIEKGKKKLEKLICYTQQQYKQQQQQQQ